MLLLLFQLISAQTSAPGGFARSRDLTQQAGLSGSDPGKPGEFAGVLSPDSEARAELYPEKVLIYAVDLKAGEFIRIDIKSQTADLLVAAFRPEGSPYRSWNVARGSTPQPVAWIAGVAGSYSLRISMPDGNLGGQWCSLGIALRRQPKEGDRSLVQASGFLSDAVGLHRKWTSDSLMQAIALYRKVSGLMTGIADQANVLCLIGDVYRYLSKNEESMQAYVRASRLNAGREIEVQVLNSIGELQRLGGDFSASAANFEKALSISRSAGFLWGKAKSLFNLGYSHYLKNRYPEAQRLLQEAMSDFELLRDSLGIAEAGLCLGYTFHALKRIDEAREFYERSLEIAGKTADRNTQSLGRTALGHLMAMTGEWQKAFEHYDSAMRLATEAGDRSMEAGILQGMAYAYRALGKRERALDLYKRSAEISEQLNDVPTSSHTYALIGEIYQELGQFEASIRHCRIALQKNNGTSSYLEASAIATMGKVYEKQGKAAAARDQYLKALGLAMRAEDTFMEGFLRNALGNIYRVSGENGKALEYLAQALALQRRSGDIVNVSATLYNLARTEQARGNLNAALSNINEAVRITELLRVKVAGQEFRASFNASVYDIHEFAIQLLMELNRSQPGKGWDVAALQASERARARSLMESLVERGAEIRTGVSRELLDRETALRRQLNLKADSLRNPNAKTKAAALSREIADLSGRLEQIQELIRAQSPHYAALNHPKPLALEQIRSNVLDPETLLLEYSLGERKSFLWAVSTETIESFALPARFEIESLVNETMMPMLARQNQNTETASLYKIRIAESDQLFRRKAAELSRMLLGPAAHLLGNKRLLIVAEGQLQHLSFAALPVPERETVPLITEHEIVKLPSASAFAVLRSEIEKRPAPSKTIAVFADPVFEVDDPRLGKRSGSQRTGGRALGSARGIALSSVKSGRNPSALRNPVEVEGRAASLARLPATRTEAEQILSLAPGQSSFRAFDFDASRSNAMNAGLGQYRVIHFATHGILHNEYPELSGLALSSLDERGRRDEYSGILRLRDIYGLDLPVDLVVLSACNSGLGSDVRGEGLVGIVRGFMYAGAARVIASLWKVEDEATAELMKRFYSHMFEKGERASAALRAAQIEMLRQKRWNAPFYWAAFVLQGEWR